MTSGSNNNMSIEMSIPSIDMLCTSAANSLVFVKRIEALT